MRGSRKDCAKAIGCNRTAYKLRGQADWRLQGAWPGTPTPRGRLLHASAGPRPLREHPEGVSSRAWPTARGCAAEPRRAGATRSRTPTRSRPGPARPKRPPRQRSPLYK